MTRINVNINPATQRALAVTVTIPVPNGCAACGIDYQETRGRWHPMVGLHQWIEPTDAQRLIRIRARRAASRG